MSLPYSVDVSYELQKAKSTSLKYSLLVALILTMVIVGDVLLVVFATEDFLWNYIVASVITTLFAWGAIFFFTNIYKRVNAKYRYFKGYESGLKPVEEVEFISKGDELTEVNGLYAYPLHMKYFDGIREQEKVIYALDSGVKYQKGDKLTITTYQRILIRAEKHR